MLLALLLATFACRAPEASRSADDLGRPVTLPPQVQHIVTLSPNITEMLFALGAQSKLIGADDNSNFPPPARQLPKVGTMQPNIEKIAALHPDIVFASSEGNSPNLGPALAAVNIPLYVVRTDRLNEIAPAMDRLGRMVDAPQRESAVHGLERAIAAQRRTRTHAPRVLFVVWTDPLYVAGSNTFTDDLYALTGAANAVEADGWPQYSLESLAAHPPDLLLYPRGSVTRAQIDVLLARAARLQPRIVDVDDDIFQRPGPRVAQAAAALNAILDAFASR
ncbi:MAG TPA: helical backbone metal receptor [Thermoanaerobaculia bacterium]|nr:helical backbone metal receptor [Thermoanaerobaculia bacterium]